MLVAVLIFATIPPAVAGMGKLTLGQRVQFGTSSGTMPTSAAVMTTYLIRNTAAGEALELLIFWRGTPGWFAKGGSSGSSGGGGGGAFGSSPGWTHRFSSGGYEFAVTFDLDSRTAVVQGKEVKLTNGANVIFVDRVDSAAGPQIVGTSKVDSAVGMDPGPARILRILGRSTEIREYLRCDTQLPDSRLQERLAPVCAQILNP